MFVANYVPGSLTGGPISHLWSLCVEMQFYLAGGTAVLLFGRRGLWLVFPAAVAITALRIDGGTGKNIMTHLRVDEILAGACLAMLVTTRGGPMHRLFSPRPVTVIGLAVVVPLWLASSHPAFKPVMYARPYLGALLICLLIYCRIGVLARLMDNPVSRYIAQVSYALYIWHPLMVAGVMSSGSDWVRYLLKRPVSYLMMAGAAHLSTFWWERFWQTAVRRHLEARRRARPLAAGRAGAAARLT